MAAPTANNLVIYKGSDFGPLVFLCRDDSGAALNIDGGAAYAEIRDACGTLIHNFAPTLSNGANGEIALPQINSATTANMTAGRYGWDLVAANAAGYRFPPSYQGAVVITAAHTQRV